MVVSGVLRGHKWSQIGDWGRQRTELVSVLLGTIKRSKLYSALRLSILRFLSYGTDSAVFRFDRRIIVVRFLSAKKSRFDPRILTIEFNF